MLLRFSLLCVSFLFVGSLQAGDKKELVLAKWKGSVADLEALKKKPKTGLVTDEETRKAIWDAWDIKKDKVDKIDFEQHILFISTTRGSILKSMPKLGEKGDLKVLAMSTRDLRPGFRYEILLLSRAGIDSVNGQKLKAKDE